MERIAFYKILEKVEYGEVNEFPAKNMILFHQVTKTFTYIIPAFFFLMSAWALSKAKKREEFKESKKEPVTTYEKSLNNY